MDTSAGQIAFTNTVSFMFEKEEGVWRIVWSDGLLFPGLRARIRCEYPHRKQSAGTYSTGTAYFSRERAR
jgi:hypothetical protein